MSKLGKKVNNILKEKNRQLRWMPVFIMMALVVFVGVFIKLSSNVIAVSLDSDVIQSITEGFDITKAIDLADLINNDLVVSNTSSSDGNTVKADIKFSYSLKSDKTVTNTSENKYVYLKLDPNVHAIDDAKSGQVWDASYGDGPSGEYVIITDEAGNDTVVIRFKNDYLNWIATDQGEGVGVQGGDFTLQANCTRGEDKSNTEYPFSIGNKTVTVPGFEAKSLNIGKTGKDNGDGTITWEITIYNPNAYNNNKSDKLDNDDYIVDTMFTKKIPADGTISGYATAYDFNGREVVTPMTLNIYNNDTLYGSELSTGSGFNVQYWGLKYTFTYTTPVDYDTSSDAYNQYSQGFDTVVDNSVRLNNNGTDIEKTATVTHTSKINVEKTTGATDYENQAVGFTITISNPDGLDLNGYKLTDAGFANKVGDITVNGASGSLNGEVLTLSNAGTGDITIEYKVSATESGDYDNNKENKVTVTNPNNQTMGSDVSYYKFNALSEGKWGNVNKTDGTFDWRIWIKSNGGASLDGAVIDDTMAQYIIDGSLTIEEDNNAQTNTNDSSLSVSYENGHFVIHASTASVVNVNYKTPLPTDENTYGATAQEDGSFIASNTATIGYKGITESVTSPNVTYASTNEVKKYAESVTINDDYTEMTVKYKIELTQEPGAFKGQTLTDDISVPNGLSLKSAISTTLFTINGQNSSWGSVNLTDKYEMAYDDSDDKFVIQFSDDVPDELTYLTISYTVVYSIDKDLTDAGQEYEVNNNLKFNGKTVDVPSTYYRPDYSTAPYKKTVNGQESLFLTTNDLADYKQGDYYVFEYVINVDFVKEKFNITSTGYSFTDTLPENFELDESAGVSYCQGSYEFAVYRKANDWDTAYYSTDVDGQIIFAVDPRTELSYIKYKAKVLCSTLDSAIESAEGLYEIENAVKHDNYESKTQIITVVPTQTEEANAVDKTGTQGMAGNYKYEVVINPDGKNYVADGATLTLVDVLTCNWYSKGADKNNLTKVPGTNKEFEADITKIEVTNANTGDAITGWTYSVESNPSEMKYPEGVTSDNVIHATKTSIWDNLYTTYTIPVTSGSQFTVNFYGVDGANGWSGQFSIGYFDANRNFQIQNGYVGITYTDGISTFTTTAGDYSEAVILMHNGEEKVKYLSVDNGTTVYGTGYEDVSALAVLTVSGLPDGTPLKINYTYSATNVDKENAGYVVAAVTNSATLNGLNKTGTYDSDYVLFDSTQATSYSTSYFSLEKVDTGNYNAKLSAGFYLSRYNAEAGGWEYAKQIKKPDADPNARYYEAVWSTDLNDKILLEVNGEEIRLQLKDGVMYRLEEYKEPDDYSHKDEFYGAAENYKVDFYFCFMNPPTDIPDEAVDNYKVIATNSKYRVMNVRKVKVSVTKTWAGLDPSINNDDLRAEFKVYYATKPTETDYSKMNEVTLADFITDTSILGENNTLLLSSNGTTEVIENLPNGEDNNGKPYYYYVKEIRYSTDAGASWTDVSESSTYQPFYSGNATVDSEGDTNIDVLNSSGLSIRKIWKDYNGDKITNLTSLPNINVDLYRVEDKGVTLIDQMIYTDDNKVASLELTKENDFIATVVVSGLDGFDANKTYKYYVKERDALTGYSVTYINNGSNGVGEMQIINRSTTPGGDYALPSTGAGGTLLFYILGFAITVSAGLLLYFKKRNSNI